MKKKFLNAILFGALMLGSVVTITSCKDYDDEIDEIRNELSSLASKDDLSSQLAQLQSALSTAASQATQASTEAGNALVAANAAATEAKAAGDAAAEAAATANAAKAAADKAAAEAKAAALAEIKGTLDSLQEQLNTVSESALKELSEAVAKAKKDLEDITGTIADSVTSVELVGTYSTDIYTWDLGFTTATAKDNVFSKGIKNAITFVKGEQYQTPASFIVRVSPANAELTPGMISLVNSQGENLDDLVEVKSVERYDGLLTKAAETSGLWTVTVQLKGYTEKVFNAAAATKDGDQILFAVQVNNTSYSETRYATSTYDLTLAWEEYEPAKELNFFVDKTAVADINNRFSGASISFNPNPNDDQDYTELAWSGDPATAAILEPVAKKNVTTDGNDNRDGKELYPAVQGKAMTITVGDLVGSKIVPSSQVHAIYVTLDTENAVESAPSELNAWNSYIYEGLDEVVEGATTKITISSKNGEAINDIIGFRVYAVNHDGTLVDPDGKAFYVVLGAQGEDWNATATTVTPQGAWVAPTATSSNKVAMKATKLTGAATATWTTDKIGNDQPVFDAKFYAGNTLLGSTATAADLASLATIDFSKVTAVQTTPTLGDWKLYEDNKTYTGTLTIKNANGHVLATLKVSMTKVLPTGIPAGFSVKTNQVVNGVWNGYLVPDVWDATQATLGTMKMTEVFNFGTPADVDKYKDHYEVIFATTGLNEKGTAYTESVTVNGGGTLEVAKDLIDNKTQHATTVQYNYGKISSVKNAKGGYDDVIREATAFQSVYNCIYNDTYSWNWATRTQLGGIYVAKDSKGNYTEPLTSAYETEMVYGGTYTLNVDKAIYGVSTRDSEYNEFLSPSYEKSIKIVSAQLISNANKSQEYFEAAVSGSQITFTVKSGSTNPTADVASTLVLKCKDSYNHDLTIELPMTVLKR